MPNNKPKLTHADCMKIFFDCLAPIVISRLEKHGRDEVFIDEVVSDVANILWEKMRAGDISFESVQDLTKWVSSCACIIERKNWIKRLEHFFNERHTRIDLSDDGIEDNDIWKEICSIFNPEDAAIAVEEIQALRAAYKALPCLMRIFLEKKTSCRSRRKKVLSKKNGAARTRYSRACQAAKEWYKDRGVVSMKDAILMGKRIQQGLPIELPRRDKKK